jgi:hypothetical protein
MIARVESPEGQSTGEPSSSPRSHKGNIKVPEA